MPPPHLGPLVLETQTASPAQGQIPGTTCLPQQGSQLVGDCSRTNPFARTEGRESGRGEARPAVCNALRGLVTMSPHITLYSGKGKCPPVLLQCESGAMWGETVHPRGIVSDVAGSVATWLMWALW